MWHAHPPFPVVQVWVRCAVHPPCSDTPIACTSLGWHHLSGQDTHRRPGERAALLPLLAATHQVVHLLHQAWFVEFLPHPGARLATPAFMTLPFSR